MTNMGRTFKTSFTKNEGSPRDLSKNTKREAEVTREIEK
jgi:hypothetical protein